MENRFCCNCGTKIEPGDMFCMECGKSLEDTTEEVTKNIKEDATNKLPEENTHETTTQTYQNDKKAEEAEECLDVINMNSGKKKSPINVIIIVVIVLVSLFGITYGAAWIYGEFFSINTPPIDAKSNLTEEAKEPDALNNNEADSEEETKEPDVKEDDTKKENSEKEVKKDSEKLDTEGIDGIVDLKYDMSDITGVWNLDFKNYVSLEGEVIGLYESTAKVTITNVDDTKFKAVFEISKASINGEPVDVGKQSFKGELNNDIISMKIDCDKDYLYTAMPYDIEFTPKSDEGKLSGTCEKKLSQKLEGHNMSYKIISKFTKK